MTRGAADAEVDARIKELSQRLFVVSAVAP